MQGQRCVCEMLIVVFPCQGYCLFGCLCNAEYQVYHHGLLRLYRNSYLNCRYRIKHRSFAIGKFPIAVYRNGVAKRPTPADESHPVGFVGYIVKGCIAYCREVYQTYGFSLSERGLRLHKIACVYEVFPFP